MSQPHSAAADSLAVRLREATAAAHTAAERTAFVRHLFRGTLPREGYVAFLRALHPVYQALEAGLASTTADPAVRMAYDPALNRLAPLEQDLAWFAGPEWRALPVVAPAEAYAAHLRMLAATAPAGLTAHAYVRYLGDLSGGQMIGKRVAATYDAGDAGTNFYAFREVPDVDARKHQYRAMLAGLPLDAAGQELVVREAITGFDYARQMFETLDAAHPSE
jgi:heme oxygenase (biliverdin-producing, ferredoxin)